MPSISRTHVFLFLLGIIVLAGATTSVRRTNAHSSNRKTVAPTAATHSLKVPVAPATVQVNQGGDLQGAINTANCGDTINVQAGATFQGNFVLKNRGACSDTNYITIQTDGNIPAAGTRICPTNASAMPKLVSPNGTAALQADDLANHYKIIGIEITNIGGSTVTPELALIAGSSFANQPHHIIFDRDWFHEATNDTSTPNAITTTAVRGLNLNATDITVTECRFGGFRAYLPAGNPDTSVQASNAILFPNSAMGVTLNNNYFEAWFAPIFFGGSGGTTAYTATLTNPTYDASTHKGTATFSSVDNLNVGDLVAFQVIDGRTPVTNSAHSNEPVVYQVAKVDGVGAGNLVSYESWGSFDGNLAGGNPLLKAPCACGSQSLSGGYTSSPIQAQWNGFLNEDITIKRNQFVENFTSTEQVWTSTGGSPTNQPRSTQTNTGNSPKGMIEIKMAKHVVIDGNTFEGWELGFVITSRNQGNGGSSGGFPWAGVFDVTISNNWWKRAVNYDRLYGFPFGGPQLEDNEYTNVRSGPLTVTNNLIESGVENFFSSFGAADNVTATHNTYPGFPNPLGGGSMIFGQGATSSAFVFRDNILSNNEYGLNCQMTDTPICWPGVTNDSRNVISGSAFNHNVIIDNRASPNGSLSTNYPNDLIAINQGSIGWTNPSGRDYRLSSSSSYRGTASDGTDPGVNWLSLVSALGFDPITYTASQCPTAPSPSPSPSPSPTVPASPTPTPVIIVRDSFTANDGVELSQHVGELGATWAQPSYSQNSKDFIYSHRVTHEATGYRNIYYASGQPPSNCYVQAAFTKLSAASGTVVAGLVLRMDPSSENYYDAHYDTSTGAWSISSNLNGTGTQLGSWADTLAAGDVRTVRFEAFGGTLTLFIDGSSRIVVSNADHSASGRAGILMSGSTSSTTGFALSSLEAGSIVLPIAPSGLVVSLGCHAHLHWSDNSSNETSFVVQRSVDGGNTFAPIRTELANETQSIFLPRPGYKQPPYLYRVVANNAAGDSAPTNTVTVPARSFRPPQICIDGELGSSCSAPVFIDDFNDNHQDTSKWNLVSAPNAVSVVEQNQRLEVSPSATTSGYNGYQTAIPIDITSASATVTLAQATVAVGSAETLYGVWGAGGGFVFSIAGGSLRLQLYAGGFTQTSVTYDSEQHRFLRIRHDAVTDQILWETSADTFTWQTQRSVARPFAISGMYPSLYAGKWANEATQPGTAIFEDMRIDRPNRAFDNFDDNSRDTAKWAMQSASGVVSVLEQNQRLEITPWANGAGFNGYQSAAGVGLTNARASVELVQSTAAVGSAETIFSAWGVGGGLAFSVKGGNLYFQLYAVDLNQTSIPYDSVQHRFLRLRHDGTSDNLFWETSSDGVTWQTQRSVVRPFTLSSMYVTLSAGKSVSEVTQPGKAIFDNYRVVDNCQIP